MTKYITFLLLLICTITYAQVDSNTRAKLYFNEAQAQFNQNEYKEALVYIKKTEKVLGAPNARTLNLKIKVYYNSGQFLKAEKALNLFINQYSNNTTETLKTETLSYFVKIENASNEARKHQARIKANRKRKEAVKLKKDKQLQIKKELAREKYRKKKEHDKKAWNKALNTNTLKAYKFYKSDIKNGLYEYQAQAAIKKLYAPIHKDIRARLKNGETPHQILRSNNDITERFFIGKNYQGGIIFSYDSSKDVVLIAAKGDLKERQKPWNAQKVAKKLDYKGYSDWYIPSISELKLMYYNLHKYRLGNFNNSVYAKQQSRRISGNITSFYFRDGTIWTGRANYKVRVRVIRKGN